MKKIIQLILVISIFFNITMQNGNIVYANNDEIQYKETNIKLIVNNNKVVFPDQKPIVIDGRTYVPVRFLAENLGAKVEWDDKHRVVIITNNGIQLTETMNEYARYYLRIGEPQMVYVTYNKKTNYPTRIEIFDLPQTPFVTSKGRTMLPFRFVSELLGAFIYYDANTNSAIAEYDQNKKIQTVYPVPILSTLVQDAFYDELMDFRLKNKPEEIKNPIMMNITKSDTLMAAATWKTLQLFDKYDHKNPDGTLYWSRFFSLYLPNTPYKFSGENIKTTRWTPPVGIQLINATSHVSGQYYYCMKDVDAFLDDSEYWYNHLSDAWGINMIPLTETSDLVYKGKSYSKYKMNSEHYLKVSGVNFHSFSLIQHWNEDVYRSYMKQEIVSWGNSYGHRSNLLTKQGNFGYGVRLINSRGYSTYAKG